MLNYRYMKLIGYARCSSGEQSTAAQVEKLKAAGCKQIYQETASGGRWDRPELHKLLDRLGKGDVLCVWKLDRLSRSLSDLLHILKKLDDAGAGFKSLTESIDTTTPAGRMMSQMLGSFAEFERAMLRERTKLGLARARAAGRNGGAKFEMSPAGQRTRFPKSMQARRRPRLRKRSTSIVQPSPGSCQSVACWSKGVSLQRRQSAQNKTSRSAGGQDAFRSDLAWLPRASATEPF